ncbi:isochorismatase family cysteine hydrolase [Bacillus sp. B15-48]|uniref:cysteine hydrolase family protein n=1 Tax=Bacillus sp. B15-48 TaxID=1548601 RepID=UPI00193EF2E7|nr:isochorismatase family cysteine hydrolase [Bacillus sp. B15-48]MBM4764842.1 isochorismatase family protein [Bacillus sp. B15-48]
MELKNNIRIDKGKTAFLIIDMQNSYCHPNGSIGRNGYNSTMMNATIPKVKELLEVSRSNGILDIWTIQNHYQDDKTRFNRLIPPHTHRWKAGSPALKDTWDAKVVDELKDFINNDTELITKHRFSSFYDTRLDTLLRMKGITTLIIAGVATTHCVETTVRDAYQRDYDVIVAGEAVAGQSLEDHESSIRLINKLFGVVLTNTQVMSLMRGEEISYDLKIESMVNE